MMKFLVLALVTTFLCLSESSEEQTFRPSFEAVLEAHYGLTLEEYKEKCIEKDEAYWAEVESIIEFGARIGEALVNDVAERVTDTYGDEEAFDHIIEEQCMGNVVLLEVKKFTFAAVANCLDEDEVPDEDAKIEIIKDSMLKTCEPIKELAKERNAR